MDHDREAAAGNAPPVLTTQVVAGALIAGVVLFATIAAIITIDKEPGDPFVAYIATAVSAVMLAARFVVPAAVAASQRKQLAARRGPELKREDFIPPYQTKTIVGYAMLEAAAMFCLVSYIISAQWWLLAMVGVLLAVMAATFPGPARFEQWADEQIQLAGLERRQ